MLLCTSYTTDIGLPLLTIHCSALSHLNGNINWARTDEWNKKRLRTDLDYIRTIRIEVACRGGMTSAVVVSEIPNFTACSCETNLSRKSRSVPGPSWYSYSIS